MWGFGECGLSCDVNLSAVFPANFLVEPALAGFLLKLQKNVLRVASKL